MLTPDAGPSDGSTDSTVADAAGDIDSNTPDGLAKDASVADASRAEAAEAADAADASVADANDANDASVADGDANDASVAEDAAGEGGSGASVADASRTKVIFVTATTENGNLSRPIAGDTAICPTDAHKPAGTASYKVILVDSQDQTRVACSNPNCAGDAGSQHVDWALAPNTTYTRPDGTVIGTTTSGAIFAFPLQNPISASNVTVWTGLNADWTTNANTCGGWLTSSGMGVVGAADQADSTSIAMASVTCTMQGAYYCVEQ